MSVSFNSIPVTLLYTGGAGVGSGLVSSVFPASTVLSLPVESVTLTSSFVLFVTVEFVFSPAVTLLPSAPSPNVISIFALAFTSVFTSVFIFVSSTFAFTTTGCSVSPFMFISAFASTVNAPTDPFAVTFTDASVPFTTNSSTFAPFSIVTSTLLSAVMFPTCAPDATVTAISFVAVKLSTFAPAATFTVAA